MRTAKLVQRTALITLMLAVSALYAITAAHADESQDTFLMGPDDTFTIDKDEPDQDPRYDEDDQRWDELDDLDHEEDEGNKQTFVPATMETVRTFWI